MASSADFLQRPREVPDSTPAPADPIQLVQRAKRGRPKKFIAIAGTSPACMPTGKANAVPATSITSQGPSAVPDETAAIWRRKPSSRKRAAEDSNNPEGGNGLQSSTPAAKWHRKKIVHATSDDPAGPAPPATKRRRKPRSAPVADNSVGPEAHPPKHGRKKRQASGTQPQKRLRKTLSASVADASAPAETHVKRKYQKRASKSKPSTSISAEDHDGSLSQEEDEKKESAFVVADKVLQSQVEWLIANAGACGSLRDVVKHLWFSYVARSLPDVKNGVEETLIKNRSWLWTLRDQDFCTLFNCKSSQLGVILKAAKQKNEAADLTGELLEEELEEMDGSCNKPKFRKVYGAASKRERVSLLAASDLYECPERLTITRIVALLALSLHVCDEQILISDLLRWSRLLQFPCEDPEVLSAEEKKSYSVFFSCNHDGTFSYPEIEYEMNAIAKHLSVWPEYLSSVSTVPVVERFIVELNLPEAMIPFVLELMDSFNSVEFRLDLKAGGRSEFVRRPGNKEVLVMASIIYSLRLLYGLDGQAETDIAVESRKLQKQLLGDVRIFRFQKWVTYIDCRRIALSRHAMLGQKSASVSTKVAHVSKNKTGSEAPLNFSHLGNAFLAQKRACRVNVLYKDLGAEIDQDFVSLPPTLRPFRAHSEALVDKFPELSKDFYPSAIDHLITIDGLKRLPKIWNVKNPDRVEGCLARIAGAQTRAWNNAYPLRGSNMSNCTIPPRLEHLPSASLRWLVSIAAEIIEHHPDSLLGQVMFIEMAMFPKNKLCRIRGKGSNNVTRMVVGE